MIRKHPKAVLFGAAGALVVVAIALIAIVMRAGGRDAFSPDEVKEIARIKGEAERLVIEGKLAEAHAKYQMIEEKIAGRKIKDTSVWDLTERAKQDQDRVYSLLLSEMESNLIVKTAAATRPATRYVVVGNEPPKEKYPTTLATEPAPQPSTRPVVASATTEPVNPFLMLKPLLERGMPSPQTKPAAIAVVPMPD